MVRINSGRSAGAFDGLPDSAFVRLAELLEGVLPFSASTTWRKVREGRFPQPVKVSCQITAWRVGDVRRWLADPAGFSDFARGNTHLDAGGQK
jgi:predicted DNA-binding transcriptional regulator AlpA